MVVLSHGPALLRLGSVQCTNRAAAGRTEAPPGGGGVPRPSQHIVFYHEFLQHMASAGGATQLGGFVQGCPDLWKGEYDSHSPDCSGHLLGKSTCAGEIMSSHLVDNKLFYHKLF